MSSIPHQGVVTGQFGPRAAAYVASAVHATGADLQELVQMLRGRHAARILDLGCGGGHVGFTVAPHAGQVVALDLSAEMLKAVAAEAMRRGLANLAVRQGAAESLPFADASFDAVFSRYSAHHWHDLDAGLAEARRVLKPGAIAAFIDVVSPGRPLLDTYLQTVELLRDPSHVRDYSAEEWERAARSAGFEAGVRSRRRLRLEFASWVERMATPNLQTQAIRTLQRSMAGDVARHFEIEPDGSFTVDTMTLTAVPA